MALGWGLEKRIDGVVKAKLDKGMELFYTFTVVGAVTAYTYQKSPN